VFSNSSIEQYVLKVISLAFIGLAFVCFTWILQNLHKGGGWVDVDELTITSIIFVTLHWLFWHQGQALPIIVVILPFLMAGLCIYWGMNDEGRRQVAFHFASGLLGVGLSASAERAGLYANIRKVKSKENDSDINQINS